MSETWIDEKGWEKIKNRLSKTHIWEGRHATKEKKKGRAKGGFLIGRKKIGDDQIN